MLAEELEEARYHMVKALRFWRQRNHDSASLMCLHFILVLNGRLGKPNEKYANEVSKLEARLHLRGDLKPFQERITCMIRILTRLEEELSP